MSKFEFVEESLKTILSGGTPDLSDRLHDDFMLIREEALVSKLEFFAYLEGNREHINAHLDVKCLFEDVISLV